MVDNSVIETCVWKLDDSGEVWETTCGQAFVLTAGTPRENDMKFCCYCGKPLEQVTKEETEDG